MGSDREEHRPRKSGSKGKGIVYFLLGALLGIWWERRREKDEGKGWRRGRPRPISELYTFDYIEDGNSSSY